MQLSFKEEKWIPITNWEHYSISNQGRVKNNISGKIRATYKNNSGYICI